MGNDYKSLVGFKDGSVLENNDYVGINGNVISMQDTSFPLIGISDKGDFKYMEPGGTYNFKGKDVLEISPDALPKYEDQLLSTHLSTLKPKDQKVFSEKYAAMSDSMKDAVLMEILRKHPSASQNIREEVKMQQGGRFEFVPEGMRLVGISSNSPTDYPRNGPTQNLNPEYPPKRANTLPAAKVPVKTTTRRTQAVPVQKVSGVERSNADSGVPTVTELVEQAVEPQKPTPVNYFQQMGISQNPALKTFNQFGDPSTWKGVPLFKDVFPNLYSKFKINANVLNIRGDIVTVQNNLGKWTFNTKTSELKKYPVKDKYVAPSRIKYNDR